MYPGLQGKVVTHEWPGPDVLAGLAESPGEARVGCGSLWGKGPREYSSALALQNITILAQRCRHTQQPAGSSAGMPQSKQPSGWERSLTHQQTSCLEPP